MFDLKHKKLKFRQILKIFTKNTKIFKKFQKILVKSHHFDN